MRSPQVELPPTLRARPYQARWIDDPSRFKIAVKCARSGFSFCSGEEALLDCLERPGTTWTVLSHGQAGSDEFIETGCSALIEVMKSTLQVYKQPYADELGKTDITARRVDFGNGSRLIALPSNPRTARGYPGNAILDEYAHHENPYEIWAAVSRQVALGHKLRVVSTPKSQGGKFYDLAKPLGLTDGVPPAQNPVKHGAWSGHWVDAHMAIADGCPIDLQETRELYGSDIDTLNQEFFCAFLSAIGTWLDVMLIHAAKDPGATMQLPIGFEPHGFIAVGVDFGRSGDRSCVWVDEYIGDVSWARHIEWQFNMPFFVSDAELRGGITDQEHWLDPFVKLADRAAMDCTGIGLGIYEKFNAKYPGKVMGINFGGTIKRVQQGEKSGERGLASTIKIKTDMAVRMRNRMQQHKNRIPDESQARSLDVVAELQAIKREETMGGAVKFAAPRIETETAAGEKRKQFSHAEAFWAKAMADLAASQPGQSFADYSAIVGAPIISAAEGAAAFGAEEMMNVEL